MVSDNDSGVGNNARVIYTPTAASTYYVQVSGISGLGTYTMSVIVLGANGVSEADTDFPETTATSGRVEVGASATGNIDRLFDQDWFRVDLEADKTYQIDMKGEGSSGTLSDPRLYNIRDSDGDEIDDTGNDDIDFDNDILDSQIIYTPTATGTYYLVAAHAGSGTGTYTLSVREVTPPSTPGFGEGVAVLLSNLGQATNMFATIAIGTFDAAQGFTTGSERSGILPGQHQAGHSYGPQNPGRRDCRAVVRGQRREP